MGFDHRKYNLINSIIIVVLVFGVSSSDNYIQQVVAIRPLSSIIMEIQSLQRGPVPPSVSSPCTYIPGRSQGRCIFDDQMAVAHPPPAFAESDHTTRNGVYGRGH